MLRTLIPRQILAHPLSVTIPPQAQLCLLQLAHKKLVLSCRVVSSTETASQTSQERPNSCRSHPQLDVWTGTELSGVLRLTQWWRRRNGWERTKETSSDIDTFHISLWINWIVRLLLVTIKIWWTKIAQRSCLSTPRLWTRRTPASSLNLQKGDYWHVLTLAISSVPHHPFQCRCKCTTYQFHFILAQDHHLYWKSRFSLFPGTNKKVSLSLARLD